MDKLLFILLYLFGIIYIVLGGLSIFATDLARKKIFNKCFQIKDWKKFAPIPIIVGILLILAASYNRYMIFILIIGILGIVKGIMMLVAADKMQAMVDWWMKAQDNVYRAWGVAMIILGSFILMGIK